MAQQNSPNSKTVSSKPDSQTLSLEELIRKLNSFKGRINLNDGDVADAVKALTEKLLDPSSNNLSSSSKEKAWRLLSEMADKKSIEANFRVGYAILKGKWSKGDSEEKLGPQMYFTKAANEGHAEAQYYLGRLYEVGHKAGVWEVKADPGQAFKWFQRAADQGGHIEALARLGNCYIQGKGVRKDETKGSDYYRAAADKGHAAAQRAIGIRLHKPPLVNGKQLTRPDLPLAYKYLRAAADQEEEQAIEALRAPEFLPFAEAERNEEAKLAAEKYLARAAKKKGDSESQFYSGFCYEYGIGVEKNLQKALDYYTEAAKQEDKHYAKDAKEKLTLKKFYSTFFGPNAETANLARKIESKKNNDNDGQEKSHGQDFYTSINNDL